MKTKQIGFIGAGNMASSLISGLISSGHLAAQIWVFDTDAEKLSHLSTLSQVNIANSNDELIEKVDVIVLAVKPQVLESVIEASKTAFMNSQALIVSIAAGINQYSLNSWLGGHKAIVRTMPNTPALVRTGATALHANDKVDSEQRDLAENIMRSVGIAVWVDDETQLDAVTAISGSGPAYFFLLMEAMEKSALELGLSAETARLLIEQTAIGSAKIALESGESPSELKARVTSPYGTTEQALKIFTEGDFTGLVIKALQAAKERSISLSDELGAK